MVHFFAWLRNITQGKVFPTYSLMTEIFRHIRELWLKDKRKTKKLLSRARIDRVILTTMDMYLHHPQIQYLGLQCLSIIISRNAFLQKQLTHYRMLEKIMVHLKYHTHDANVVASSIVGLWHCFDCHAQKLPTECATLVVNVLCQDCHGCFEAVHSYCVRILYFLTPYQILASNCQQILTFLTTCRGTTSAHIKLAVSLKELVASLVIQRRWRVFDHQKKYSQRVQIKRSICAGKKVRCTTISLPLHFRTKRPGKEISDTPSSLSSSTSCSTKKRVLPLKKRKRPW